MNEDTMNRACHLLLKAYDSEDGSAINAEASNSDHPNKKKGKEEASNGDSTKSAKDQLLEMYYKCQDSLAVIRKQHSILPSSTATITNNSSNNITNSINKGHHHHKMMLPSGVPSLNGMKKRTVMTSKHGIHPSHKISSSAIGLAMAMKRKASFSNKLGGASGSTSSSIAAHGKAMLGHRGRSVSPPQPSSHLRGNEDSGSSAAPPPSALSFLAKLNRDPKEALAADASTKEEDVGEEKECSERYKKNKKKKKAKSKRKNSDGEENTEEKEKIEETEDSEKMKGRKKEAEGRESHRKKRRRPSNGDDNDSKSNEPHFRRKKVARRDDQASKERPVVDDDDKDEGENPEDSTNKEKEEELSSSSGDEDDDNDDGDTSADETYHGRSETSPSKRKTFSRKAKPDAESLAGGTPPSKRRKNSGEAASESGEDPSPSRRRRKARNEAASESSEDPSPSRRRNLRRGSS